MEKEDIKEVETEEFKKLDKEGIRELHLYSSGKRAVINHWFNKDEGVESLSKASPGSAVPSF